MNRLLIIGVAVLGCGSLVLSVRSSWFDLPIAFRSVQDHLHVVTEEPRSTPYYQIAAACIAAYTLAAWLANGIWRHSLPLVLAIWMAVLLLFPWTVMVLDAEIAGRATSLQTQHENLTWLGGDLATSQERAALNWKNRLYIVDTPTTVSLATPPDWKPWQTGLQRLPQLIEWLGYTNTFCQFARRSWMLALFGTACLIATNCFVRGRFVVARMQRALHLCAVVLLLGCLVAWGIQFKAGGSIRQAAACSREGNYSHALRHLERASCVLPTLRFDTDYLTQRGLLEYLAGNNTPFAGLVKAHVLEREGRYAKAEQVYEGLLTEIASSPKSPIHLEACRGLLRSAVHALNCGDDGQAIRQLQRVLDFDPCNLKANYVLQLAYLRGGEHGAMLDLVERLYATYACFKFPNKKVVLAAGQQNISFAAFQQGDLYETWRRAMKAKHP